ncbi:tRNA (adenine(58)-N(1))-methyltransferase non-catalytic subunit trm6 [Ipomoea triloba]|uniref:tRNA (adenine(58)-N(1))-methyltransferase non-catalytic subunit trm6 n=1 Tax=Ipomoea triloba TaxID=35885 RepID=UPI00125DEE3D|nr:tRNA (adenine(58)-N(1))-methyltransferase non-catalytic subunit trm6 [Ipomoea triloba]
MSVNEAIPEHSYQNKSLNPRITWEGCSVLLDINDGDRLVFARLTHASRLKIGNKNYSLQPLIGCPYGSLFQVESGEGGPILARVSPAIEGNNLEAESDSQTTDVSKDNRALVDNNTAQSLTGEDIDEMRRQGASGDEIVKALIANSATFEKKTQFSQEKYKLKKQKKYAPKVLLRRPYARSICEAYFKKHPDRTGFMRVDTLSLLLSMANVTAHANVLVVDKVGGLVTGAVAERLGGTGYVCNTYRGVAPYPTDIIRIFNLSDEISRRIVHASLADLCTSQTGASTSEDGVDQACNIRSQSNLSNELLQEEIPCTSSVQSVGVEGAGVSSDDGNMEITPEKVGSPVIKPCKAPKAGEKAPLEVVNSWKENGFSSLIIAAPEMDPWSIIKDILPLLSFSASFAVYHQYAQPLATCMHNLQVEKLAIGLQISEPWLREYQVLPSRTHPHMQMSAFGGYILSGTRICSNDQMHS